MAVPLGQKVNYQFKSIAGVGPKLKHMINWPAGSITPCVPFNYAGKLTTIPQRGVINGSRNFKLI